MDEPGAPDKTGMQKGTI